VDDAVAVAVDNIWDVVMVMPNRTVVVTKASGNARKRKKIEFSHKLSIKLNSNCACKI